MRTISQTNNVEIPFRIAVNSEKKIYVSQAGNNNPAVLIFDNNLNLKGQLPNIDSPGSVVVDKLDFIHVLEYANRIKFGEFLNNLDNVFYLLGAVNQIKQGITNHDFKIKIFNSTGTLETSFIDHIAFPVDLAFFSCGNKMFVNNTNIVYKGFFPQLKFSLEIYNRSPSLDTEPPSIQCPEDIEALASSGTNYAVVNFDDPVVSDNCGLKDLVQTKGPPSGSRFQVGTTTIEYTASDNAGNENTCDFTITVTGSDQAPIFTDCPSGINKINDPGECGAIVNFDTPTATNSTGNVQVTQIAGPHSGDLFPIGDTNVTFQAEDIDGITSTCSFKVTVIDTEKPVISCGTEDITVTAKPGENFAVVTFPDPMATDNCEATVTQISGLASGSKFPLEDTVVTFEAKDPSANIARCSFTVTVNKNTDHEKPEISCPEDISISNDPGKCGAVVNYTVPTATDNSGKVTVSLKNGPKPGADFPVGTTTVTYTATDAAGNSIDCSFDVTVTDNENPMISCPPDQTENFNPAIGFSIPDYKSLATITDNCGISSITQNPAPETVVYGDTPIKITAEDFSGNPSECTFMLFLTEEEVLQISCLEDTTINKDENCEAKVPDFSGSVTISSSTATYSQTPKAGSVITEDTPIVVSASENGQTDSCSFMLFLKDGIAPVIDCPTTTNINYSGSWPLPDYSQILNISDNCTSFENLKFTQSPPPGTSYTADGSIEVKFSVTDESDYTTTCNFTVNLSSTGGTNNKPVANNDQYPVDENTSLTVNSSDGILNNDSDAEYDTLTAILQSQPTHGTLTLNPDGSFVYTPNTDYRGPDSFTYVANDGTADSNIATVSIQVNASNPSEPDFSCKDNITLPLNENGEASIVASNLYIGTGNGYTFTLSQSGFTCADIGENSVRLSFNGTNTRGYCDVTVIVKDTLPPVVQTKDITINLDADGVASITPQMLDNGTTDNCSEVTLSLSKYNFGCKEIGENVVTFTATDAYGNTSSTFVNITVAGDCNTNPLDEQYIYIYPNPTQGDFQFYVPPGFELFRAELYDMRGRNILSKDFPEGSAVYSMDITGLEEAVYTLKLFTNQGTKIVRVIKK